MKKLKLLNKPVVYFLFIFFLFSVLQNNFTEPNHSGNAKKEIFQKIIKINISANSIEIDEQNEMEGESAHRFLKARGYDLFIRYSSRNHDEKFYQSKLFKQLSRLRLQTHSPPSLFKLS